MTKKKLRKLGSLVFGGAVAVKSTDVLRHAGDSTALAGDIQGLAGVGVASAFGTAAMDMALGKPRHRKRKRR